MNHGRSSGYPLPKKYRLWPHLLPFLTPSTLRSLWRGEPRSLSADVARIMRRLRLAFRLENLDYIPRHGSFVVVVNHYCRPGLGAWWMGLLVTHALAQRRRDEVRWVMTREWFYTHPLRRRIETPLTRWAFAKLSKAYGFILMPPMPPRPDEQWGRAVAVYRTLRLLDREEAIVALAPEGRASGDGRLVELPPGAGRFLLRLGRTGVPFLPAGVAEREGILTLLFGPPFHLQPPSGLSRPEEDRWAGLRVMVAIGRLLPPELWGPYAQELRREEGH